jgi:hypothetical protein
MTPLDQAFRDMEQGGEPQALGFYRLLADANLILLLSAEPEGDVIAPEVFELSDGPVLLAFDSEDRLASFRQGPAAYATLPGRVIAQQMAGQGLWLGLNLGTGAASETLLPPEAMTHLLSLLDVAPTEGEARAKGFAAPQVPAEVEVALHGVMARFSGLAVAGVLAAVTYESMGRGHVLALIGTTAEARPALAKAVAEALGFAGLEAAALDVTFLEPDAPSLTAMLAVGQVFKVPEPQTAKPASIPLPPGMDPEKPPKLR